jgi:hypothetical protein
MKKLHPSLLDRSLLTEVAEKIAQLSKSGAINVPDMVDSLVEGRRLLEDQKGNFVALDKALLDPVGTPQRDFAWPVESFVDATQVKPDTIIQTIEPDPSVDWDMERMAIKRSLEKLVRLYSAPQKKAMKL